MAPENPPAFPQAVSVADSGEKVCSGDFVGGEGMKLRDYFAAHAIASFSSAEAWAALKDDAVARGMEIPEVLARAVYEIADALLVERTKGGR